MASAEGRRKPVISVSRVMPTSDILLPVTGYSVVHVLYHSPFRSKGRCFSKTFVFQEWKHEVRFIWEFLPRMAKKKESWKGVSIPSRWGPFWKVQHKTSQYYSTSIVCIEYFLLVMKLKTEIWAFTSLPARIPGLKVSSKPPVYFFRYECELWSCNPSAVLAL